MVVGTQQPLTMFPLDCHVCGRDADALVSFETSDGETPVHGACSGHVLDVMASAVLAEPVRRPELHICDVDQYRPWGSAA